MFRYVIVARDRTIATMDTTERMAVRTRNPPSNERRPAPVVLGSRSIAHPLRGSTRARAYTFPYRG
ncbi:hypothetical protein JCM33774_05330 [Actinophytocola sp. KF-1]